MGSRGGGGGRSGRVRVQSFEQFAAQRNAPRFGGDVATNRLPGASAGQRARIQKLQGRQIAENAVRRDSARADYDRAVSSGAIRPPTRTESLIAAARGNPDNASTQAARRLLGKQGIKF